MFSFRFSFLVLLIFLFLFTKASAQLLHLESAESISLSSSIQSSPALHSLNLNPSLNTADSSHSFLISLAVTPNVQGLADAYSAAAEAIYFSSNVGLSFSLGVSQLKFSESYANVDGFIGVSKTIQLANQRKATIGGRFRYESFSFSSNYLPLKFYLFDLGLSFDLSEEFSIGATAINLFGSGYTVANDNREEQPQLFLIGASYHPTEVPIGLYASIEEQESVGLTMHFGASYSPISYLVIRAGSSTDTGDITAGAGLIYEGFGVDVGMHFGNILGNSLTFGLNGRW